MSCAAAGAGGLLDGRAGAPGGGRAGRCVMFCPAVNGNFHQSWVITATCARERWRGSSSAASTPSQRITPPVGR